MQFNPVPERIRRSDDEAPRPPEPADLDGFLRVDHIGQVELLLLHDLLDLGPFDEGDARTPCQGGLELVAQVPFQSRNLSVLLDEIEEGDGVVGYPAGDQSFGQLTEEQREIKGCGNPGCEKNRPGEDRVNGEPGNPPEHWHWNSHVR